jgi:S-DNA-T family DNA segregation ATPase FtsK/SpoIIIE
MLIAGTTGSGKSVCMNSIIISLLYKASPDDVKLIMVDPKMVELGIYNGIPHLLIPVVTDPKKAAGSLQWAVTEMMRRYKSMSDAGVRDLESYNAIMESEQGNKLPQVVVIIDELADLMLVAAKEVEESICRIAQMGRAAGIHLIIATQRPSADVITGLMKANIPSRIAFAVSSAMESRIILDTQGAEKLVGRGDMLYAPIGAGKPLRVQGCFVSDAEVESVANYVKEHFNTDYDKAVLEEIEKKAAQTGSGKATASDPEPAQAEMEGDEMLPAAVDVILETGQASVSMLQRRLKLGYARAARIVDEMEEKGIVGPFQGSKPRTILITKEQWEAMKAGQPSQVSFDDLDEGDDDGDGVPDDLF